MSSCKVRYQISQGSGGKVDMKRQTGKCSCQIRFKLVIGDKLSEQLLCDVGGYRTLLHMVPVLRTYYSNPTLAAGRIGLSPNPLYPSALLHLYAVHTGSTFLLRTGYPSRPSKASRAATAALNAGLDWMRTSVITARPAERGRCADRSSHGTCRRSRQFETTAWGFLRFNL